MIIAHLASGYLLSKWLKKRLDRKLPWKSILLAGLLGSIFPDFDLLYFYLLDGRQHLHHSYPTHIPFYWAVTYLLCGVVFAITGRRRLFYLSSVFIFGALLHLMLDSIVGAIRWYYPFTNESVTMVRVLPKYDWWILNFVLHWTFLLELVIVLAATMVYVRSRRNERRRSMMMQSEYY